MAESEDYLRDFPRALANSMVTALRAKLDLDLDTCYLTAFISPVDGMPVGNIVQICPSDANPWGDGEGGQEGGVCCTDQRYLIGLFFNVNMDPHQMSEEALVEISRGVLDFSEKVKSMLRGAMFKDEDGEYFSQQLTQMRYVSETGVQVVDGDSVLLMKQLVFAQPFAMPLVDSTQTIGYS